MKYRSLLPLILIGSITFGFSAVCQAACTLTLTTSNVSVSWDLGFASQAVSFTLNKNGQACNYKVGLTAGGTGAGNYTTRRMLAGTTQLPYQLYKDSGLSKILEDGTAITVANGFVGSFPNGNNRSVTLTYYLAIPSQSPLKPSGSYTDTYSVNAYEDTTLRTTASVTLTTTVPKTTELSQVATGQAFDSGQSNQSLNFGTLTSSGGTTLSYDLLVRSNAGYSVTLSSQNNGALKHAASGITQTLPYSFSVNSVSYNLTGSSTVPVTVATGTGQTLTSGVRNTVSITPSSITDLDVLSGTYTDNITVTTTVTE